VDDQVAAGLTTGSEGVLFRPGRGLAARILSTASGTWRSCSSTRPIERANLNIARRRNDKESHSCLQQPKSSTTVTCVAT
jgi:hypothetical protein